MGDDITLLGYSMGGAIAPAFAAAHPSRLCQLVLIAPVGLGHDLGPATRLLTNTGILGTWAMHTLYPRSFRRACESERTRPGQMVDIQIAQLTRRGFVPVVLSSLRGIMDWPMRDIHRALTETGLPVLAIWGETDDIIPLSGREALSALNRRIRLSYRLAYPAGVQSAANRLHRSVETHRVVRAQAHRLNAG